MKPSTARFLLAALLQLTGYGLIVAFIFVLLPTSVLAAIHAWLGLGEFPLRPITVYLARSTSLLYGVHGVLMLAVGRNLIQFQPLVSIFGWLHVVIGLTMLTIDGTSGMPLWWTAVEGLPVAATGAVIVWLDHRAFKKIDGTNQQP